MQQSCAPSLPLSFIAATAWLQVCLQSDTRMKSTLCDHSDESMLSETIQFLPFAQTTKLSQSSELQFALSICWPSQMTAIAHQQIGWLCFVFLPQLAVQFFVLFQVTLLRVLFCSCHQQTWHWVLRMVILCNCNQICMEKVSVADAKGAHLMILDFLLKHLWQWQLIMGSVHGNQCIRLRCQQIVDSSPVVAKFAISKWSSWLMPITDTPKCDWFERLWWTSKSDW